MPTTYFDLPKELRLVIYEYAVAQPDSEFWGDSISPVEPELKYRRFTIRYKQPPLTKVCRIIRHEALPVFYSINTFAFPFHISSDFKSLNISRWLRAIGDNIKHITSLLLIAPAEGVLHLFRPIGQKGLRLGRLDLHSHRITQFTTWSIRLKQGEPTIHESIDELLKRLDEAFDMRVLRAIIDYVAYAHQRVMRGLHLERGAGDFYESIEDIDPERKAV